MADDTTETKSKRALQVGSTREFDDFYQASIKQIELNDVTSGLALEVVKHTTSLPI